MLLLVGCSGGDAAPQTSDAPVAAGAVVGDNKKEAGEAGGRGAQPAAPPGQGRTGGSAPPPL